MWRTSFSSPSTRSSQAEIVCALFRHVGIDVTPEAEAWATSGVHLLFVISHKLKKRRSV